jgi:integrase
MKPHYSLFRQGQIWHYRFRLDGLRRQRSTGETSRPAAEAIAEEAFEAAKLRARGEEPEPTLGALVGLWIQAHALVFSPARIRTMENLLVHHLDPLKQLKLREITTKRVEDARVLYLQNHARESANTWLFALGALLHWAIKRRMIREMPFQVAKLKVQRKPKVLLPRDKARPWMEAVTTLTKADPGITLVVRICIGLGLRISEALEARWEWLDFERGTYTPGNTKGREAWERRVSPWLLEQLRPMAKLTGPIVPMRPGHRITENRVAYAMSKANRVAGVLHLTPHRLRGTYATWLAEKGVPIQDIQRALGHKDSRTTMRYLEVSLERIAAAQDSIGDWLGFAGQDVGTPAPADTRQAKLPDFDRRIHKDTEVLQTVTTKVRRLGR